MQYKNYKYLKYIEFILRIDLSISCNLNCTAFIKLIVGLLLGEMLCLHLFVYMLLLIYATLETKVSCSASYFDSCPISLPLQVVDFIYELCGLILFLVISNFILLDVGPLIL
jgi:hypothetical protein